MHACALTRSLHSRKTDNTARSRLTNANDTTHARHTAPSHCTSTGRARRLAGVRARLGIYLLTLVLEHKHTAHENIKTRQATSAPRRAADKKAAAAPKGILARCPTIAKTGQIVLKSPPPRPAPALVHLGAAKGLDRIDRDAVPTEKPTSQQRWEPIATAFCDIVIMYFWQQQTHKTKRTGRLDR